MLRLIPLRKSNSIGIFLKVLAVFCLGSTLFAGDSSQAIQPKVSDFTAKDVSTLVSEGSRGLVLFFVSTECPVSNGYAPEYRRIAAEFGSHGILFKLVYPNSDESTEEIAKHLREYELPLDALRDPHHVLCNAAHVRVTPEAAVYLPGHGWVYHGRIDDRQVDFGKARPAPLKRDLREILARVVKGEDISPSSTRAVGCYISESK